MNLPNTINACVIVYAVNKTGAKEILIPAIKDCILDVDIKGGRMTVRLLDGLR